MKTMFHILAFGVLALSMVVGGLLLTRPTFADSIFHPEEAGVRMEVHQANKFVSNRAPQIEKKTFGQKGSYTNPNGDIDPNKWFGVAMTAADNVRDDRRMRAAAIARAKDEDERIPQAVVLGKETSWVTVAEVRVPTRITVPASDEITPDYRPSEKSNADGVPINFSKHKKDQTLLMNERAKRKMSMVGTGNVGELVGKLYYDNGSRSLGFPMGTDSVLCVGPGFHEGGNLAARPNGWAVIDEAETSIEMGSTKGKFRLTIVPDKPEIGQTFATEICKANPGALVVKRPA